MSARKTFSRRHEIQRLRARLEKLGFPRLQMLLLVALTGGAGFLASVLLLRLGLAHMGWRYLAAMGIAYVVFLTLLWLWLRANGDDAGELGDALELGADAGDMLGNFASAPARASRLAAEPAPARAISESRGESGFELAELPGGDALSAVGEAEEFAIPLFLLILVGTLLVSSLLLVYSAPLLFAELLVDGVLSASLYRRLRGLETRHWLETALRRTAAPFVMTALLVGGCGWGLQLYAPDAATLGQILHGTPAPAGAAAPYQAPT